MPVAAILILGAYAIMSLVTYAVYAWDKHRAKAGGRRVPEKTLQTLAMLGGWPGALLGRARLRHKTRKRAFSALLFAIALLHVAFWIWFFVQGR